MKRRIVLYFLLCLSIFLSLCLIEIFILKPLVDMISFKDSIQYIIYIVLFIIINPVVTKLIADQTKIAILPQEVQKPEI